MIWRRFSGAVEFKMFGAGGAGVALDCVLSVVWEEETDCLLLLPALDWFLAVDLEVSGTVLCRGSCPGLSL